MPATFPPTAVLRQLGRQPASSRTFSIALQPTRNNICLLCQHRPWQPLTIRTFHNSRALRARFNVNASATPENSATTEQPSDSSTDEADALINKPPDITNHYTIFPKTIPNPPPQGPFAISLPELRREFLNLQSRAHPDKYPPGLEKQRAEALSARINEAYRTLSDPLTRAQYLLAAQHGIDVTAEDGAQSHPQDPETLMQVLEVQEMIEEAQDEVMVAALKEENEERIKGCVAMLGDALDKGDVEGARKECVRLRYWYTIREGLREWEPGKGVRLVH
ncbi:hypothetical protein FQN55_002955 [Onygenales sp. PD_40]|nr:hypothetical protein FQN55_002955 [Onygenales sp. PD_40]